MEKCLETRLLATVQNDELLKVGEMLLKAVNTTTGTLHAYMQGALNADVRANVKNGEWMGGGTGEKISTTSPVDIIPANAGALVVIGNKYNLTRLQLNYVFELNLEDIRYTLINFLRCYHTNGNIESIKNLPLATLDISGDFYGSISNIPTSVTSLTLRSNRINGNINTALAQHTSLTSVNVSNCPNITGSAATFLAAHPGCTLTYANSGITD